MAQPYSLSDSALNLPHPTFPRRTFAAALERVPVGAGEGAGEDDATVLLSSHLRGDSSSPERSPVLRTAFCKGFVASY